MRSYSGNRHVRKVRPNTNTHVNYVKANTKTKTNTKTQDIESPIHGWVSVSQRRGKLSTLRVRAEGKGESK
jgi:hypothetical protein